MPEKYYEKIQALIVDDFESFRLTLAKILRSLGVGSVDTAASGSDALRKCAIKAYDIILCDQNLGKGKTGQQVLEVLRHQPNLNSDCLFILISAETDKSIIMAAYDYEPDGYLTKPITAQTLGLRIQKLVAQRVALAPIYRALKDNKAADAIQLCEAELAAGNRYANVCQKILGGLLLQVGRYRDAEELYRSILDVRQLDWAMLGMAQAKKMQGDSLGAQQWLDEIIQINPLYLKAYDVQAKIAEERGDSIEQQRIVQQAVEISPLSILRQQLLGDVSMKNNDLIGAANAYRKAVKLGENSCHDAISYHENFIRAAIQVVKYDKEANKGIFRDALKAAAEIPLYFDKTDENKINACLFESQLYSASGDEKRAADMLLKAKKLMEQEGQPPTLASNIELIKSLRELGNQAESERLLSELLEACKDNEEQLQLLDCLLAEPLSEKNKLRMKKVNRDGIAFYNSHNFSRAIDCFSGALQDFPQHIGLRLNLVQALIEDYKQNAQKVALLAFAHHNLDLLSKSIPENHEQYQRFHQLQEVLQHLMATPLAQTKMA